MLDSAVTRRDFLRRAAWVGAAVGAAPALLEACGSSSSPKAAPPKPMGPPRTLSFGYDESPTSGYGFFVDTFARKVAALSNGNVTINAFPNATAGTEPQLGPKIIAGTVDLALNSTANISPIVPQAAVFAVHYIFNDYDHLTRGCNDLLLNFIFRDMFKATPGAAGAMCLGLMTLGLRNIYSKAPVHSVKDVQGHKMRIQAAQTEEEYWGAYGATWVHMPVGNVYSALKDGTVDMAENGNDVYLQQKHYEVAPYLNNSQHASNNTVVLMSQKTWNSLAPDQQSWIQQANDYARPIGVAKSVELDKAAVQTLQGLGVQYIPDVDKQSFLNIAGTDFQDRIVARLGPFAQEALMRVRQLAKGND